MDNTNTLDTVKKLRQAIEAILPGAAIEFDNNNQVVIYSGKFADERSDDRDALCDLSEWAR
jgi:hypothetical protein